MRKLKFGNLWSKAKALGCDYIATGHYAIIDHGAGTPASRRGECAAAPAAVLRKSVDRRKDQSYFLFSLRQPQLRRALTPLGTMTKPQIREIAHSLGLKVADKIDSQEICFVPGNDYKAFLRSHLGDTGFIAARFTMSMEISSASMMASSFSPSASAKDCPAVRRVRATSSISMRKQIA